MTRERLTEALIDLGWVTLIHMALNGKPAETYALRQLLRCAGRPQTHAAIAEEYEVMAPGKTLSGSVNAVSKRIERLRRALEDIGCAGAIKTVLGGYVMEKADARRVEAALVFAAGFELVDEAAA